MITAHPFGALPDGTPVTCYRLETEHHAYVEVLDYGATVRAIVVPDRQGVLRDVVLGYDTPQGYAQGALYFGATVGRHANRIGGGCFTLNGETYQLERNSGPNHSHGGSQGFHQRMFTGEVAGDALRLHLTSQDGDQGYPGTLQVTVTFQFSEDGTLSIHYLGTTDRDTVVNLTNHSYFDLSAGAAPLAQRLQLTARYYTENDENTLPTGVIAPVAGTPFDFTQEKPLGRDIEEDHPQLLRCRGYDHNFVLENDGTLQPFGTLWSPETGIALEASTDMPGVQLYTGNFVEEPQGKAGRHYVPRDGVCLETQFFPNAMGVRDFQKPILRAGDTYDHRTTYRFFIR